MIIFVSVKENFFRVSFLKIAESNRQVIINDFLRVMPAAKQIKKGVYALNIRFSSELRGFLTKYGVEMDQKGSASTFKQKV